MEESQAVYRWEYGESLFSHIHSGIILKGSQIIVPHFNLEKSTMMISESSNPFENVSESDKDNIRAYIEKCKGKKAELSEESRK